jgi:hypothetical protein
MNLEEISFSTTTFIDTTIYHYPPPPPPALILDAIPCTVILQPQHHVSGSVDELQVG